jgi:DNA mismatch repair protein MLH1
LAKKRKKGADENDEQSGESDGEDKQEGSSTRASQGGLTTPSKWLHPFIFHSLKYWIVARVPSQHKVRTSAMDRTIDSMFTVHNPSLVDTSKYRDENTNVDEIDVDQEPATQVSKTEEIKESTCYLGSIALLRQAVGKNKHEREEHAFSVHSVG